MSKFSQVPADLFSRSIPLQIPSYIIQNLKTRRLEGWRWVDEILTKISLQDCLVCIAFAWGEDLLFGGRCFIN